MSHQNSIFKYSLMIYFSSLYKLIISVLIAYITIPLVSLKIVCKVTRGEMFLIITMKHKNFLLRYFWLHLKLFLVGNWPDLFYRISENYLTGKLHTTVLPHSVTWAFALCYRSPRKLFFLSRCLEYTLCLHLVWTTDVCLIFTATLFFIYRLWHNIIVYWWFRKCVAKNSPQESADHLTQHLQNLRTFNKFNNSFT